MELNFLKKFEGQKVKIVLKNNFSYSYVEFRITSQGLLEFRDRNGDIISLEPEFIVMISKINGDYKNE